MFKIKLVLILIIIGLVCWITHIISHISRMKNTPNLIKKFKVEVKPDLDTAFQHSQLNIGANRLMAKQAVCAFGLWTLQLRYSDMETLNKLFGDTLLMYYHRLQKPIQLCAQDPYRKNFVKVLKNFIRNLNSYRTSVTYNKSRKHSRGDLIRSIKIRLKHKFSTYQSMLK